MSVFDLHSHPQALHYFKWINIPSEVLLKKSKAFYKNKETIDSAFIYANVVANRYSPNLSDKEKILCARSHITLWYLNFAYYNDFAKAYAHILKAEEIKNELHIEIPVIDMDMGCFYVVISDQNNDKNLKKEALSFYKKALKASYNLKENQVFNYSFYNILFLLLENYESIPNEWELYQKAHFASKDSLYTFNKKCYRVLELMNKHMYDEALKQIDNIHVHKSYSDDEGRTLYNLKSMKAYIYDKKGDIESALNEMKKAENIATVYNINEVKLDALNKISYYYRLLKRNTESQEYKNKYLTLKDSVFGYRQISNINNMKFLAKINKMNFEIMQMKQQRIIKNIFISIICIILTIIAFATLMLFIKNKQISKKNKTLYNNYKNLCKVEEELKIKLKKNAENTNESEQEPKLKYNNSSMSDEEKDVLYEKIISIMVDTEEIYSADFSSERLAELVGTQYKYVSQVINEKYGKSFSTLVNKYRIKEVCRRFSETDKYKNYTTEAIARCVGFNTRATFINAFKKEIGMTPLQYLKLMQKDKTLIK